jgi:cytochrome c biogenesis protein CcmG/thiol:disulfide interchange protein DsbE
MRYKSSVYGIVAVFVLVFSLNCSSDQGTAKAEAQGTEKAPDFTLVTLDGKTVSLADYKGKALILNVWDTWCPPCRAEIPDFIELYTEYRSEGLEFLGVAGGTRGGEAVVRSFIEENGINYPNAMLNENFLKGYRGIRSIPTTFVIDKEGKIYKKYVGARSKAVFESDIRALLAL